MKSLRFLCKFLVLTIILTSITILIPLESSAATYTLTVGPGRQYSTPQAAFDAIPAGSSDSYIIEIYSDGVYYGSGALLGISGKNNITLRGMNGRAQIIAQPGLRLTWGKALWVVNAQNITIENIEFQGATCSDKNGGGIRVDPSAEGTLLIKNCYFHHNDNGILAAAPSGSLNMVVEGSEFGYNGYGDGYSHNMYIGNVTSFSLRYSYSHHTKIGHLVKTRAKENYIEYNRLTDEDTSSTYNSSSNIDIADDGLAYIIGNIIQQGTDTSNNKRVISYNQEDAYSNPGKNLYVINNTIVNDRSDATFLQAGSDTSYTVTYKNNIFTGSGAITSGTVTWNGSNNINNADPGFVNRSGFDYRLTSSSTTAINQGTAPGTGDGYSLTPVKCYAHRLGSIIRTIAGGVIDIGAYEYGAVLPVPSPTPTARPTPSPSPKPTTPAGVWYSKLAWADGQYFLGAENIGTVTAEFDVTPLTASGGTMGYADTSESYGSIDHWNHLAAIVRMNSTGYFDVYNGTDYASLTGVPFSVNNKYHVKLVIQLNPVKLYDVWITPPGGSPVKIADDFLFRSSAPLMDDLGVLSLKAEVTDNNFKVENHSIISGSVTPSPFPSPSLSPSASPSVLLDENFNSAATGQVPAGWSVAENGGTARVAEYPSASDKSFKLDKIATGSELSAEKSITQTSGEVVVEVSINKTSGTYANPLYVYDSGGAVVFSMAYSGNNVNVYYSGAWHTVATMSTGSWYDYRIVLDTSTDKFDLYQNGVQKVSQAGFRTASANISKIKMFLDSGSLSTVYFDDIKVYIGAAPVPSPSPSALLDENFNSAVTGQVPAGWTVAENGGTARAAEYPSALDKSLKLDKTATGSELSAEKSITQTSGEVVVEVSINKTSGTYANPLYVYDSGGAVVFSMAYSGNNVNVYYSGAWHTVATISTGSWYDYRIVLDTSTDKFDLYQNGVQKVSQASFRTASANISKIKMFLDSGSLSTVYFDDIKVYEVN